MNEKVFLTDDCISREAALAVIEEKQKELCPAGLWGRKFTYDKDKYDAWQEILEELEVIPATDVEPVRPTGHWEIDDGRNHCHCTNCLFGRDTRTQIGWDYCPNCGAKILMEGNNG